MNIEKIHIAKSLHIESAPLAGYTDRAMRRVLIECGAKVVYTEMISVAALSFNSEKTLNMLSLDKVKGVKNVVQLFGNKPELFAAAVTHPALSDFDEININMGCPAKKIVSSGEGAALMLDMPLAEEIIKSCIENTKKTVTVKMRLGYEDIDRDVNEGEPVEVLELARICERLGVKKIIVHGRVATQQFRGTADWHAIARVVEAVDIPVIANGDIKDLETARECLAITKAAGLMIGRAIIGAPWKIALLPTPGQEEVKRIIRMHLDEARIDGIGIPHLRKHLLQYFDHLDGGKELKPEISKATDYDQIFSMLGSS